MSASTEAMVPVERLENAVALYLNRAARNDPRASPLFAQFLKPPSVLIQVGKGEGLADDACGMARVLREAGSNVTLDEWDTSLHVFQILDGWVPEARRALREIAHLFRPFWTAPSGS